MANVIKKTTNNFANGLVMDLSPENTLNKVLTHALNATLLTSNGNELSLQNDMGNCRVETAFLPTGYVPVGSAEFGGIIYVASYNPIDGKSLIGSFPSPQRNLTNFEEGDASVGFKLEDFIEKENDNIWYVKNTSKLYELTTSNKLYLGDLFMVYSSDFNSKLFTYKLIIKNDQNEEEVIENAEIKTVKTNDKNKIDPKDLENYRDKVNSDFTVISTKNSGKLCAKIGLNIPNEFKLNVNNYEILDKDLVLLISGSWEEFSKIKLTIKGEKSDYSLYLNVDGLTSINISDYDKYGEYLLLIFTPIVLINCKIDKTYLDIDVEVRELQIKETIIKSKLSTGTFDVTEWRYFKLGGDNPNIVLRHNLVGYNESGKNYTGYTINYIPCDVLKEHIDNLEEVLGDNGVSSLAEYSLYYSDFSNYLDIIQLYLNEQEVNKLKDLYLYLALIVSFYEQTDPGWSYVIEDDNHLIIKGSDKNVVKINFTNSDQIPWKGESKNITKVTIDGNLNEIGLLAFCNLENLTAITIPSSVTKIGSHAFCGCSKLNTIKFTNVENITEIGDNAFYGCDNITTVEINDIDGWCNIEFINYTSNPLYHGANLDIEDENSNELSDSYVTINSVKYPLQSIKNYTFFGCSNLTNCSLLASLIEPVTRPFSNCSGLIIDNNDKSIISNGTLLLGSSECTTIPNEVAVIGDYAFEHCTNLNEIDLNGVNKIGTKAFYNCNKLKSIHISTALENIGSDAFKYIVYSEGTIGLNVKENLCDVKIDSEDINLISDIQKSLSAYNFNFIFVKGILFTILDNTLIFKPYTSADKITHTEILDLEDEEIPLWLKLNPNINNIQIGNGITKIGKNIINNLDERISITIPGSVESIAANFCNNCYIGELKILGSEESLSININAFNNSSIEKLIIDRNIETNIETEGETDSAGIEDDQDIYKVSSVFDTVYVEIGGLCSNLSINTNNQGELNQLNVVFLFSDKLESIYFHLGGDLFLSSSLFSNNYVKNVFVSSIENVWCKISFENGQSNPLHSGADLYEVDDDGNTIKISVLKLNVENISNYAFYGSTIHEIDLGTEVTSIGKYAFSRCDNITSIFIPDNVTNIGLYAFKECANLVTFRSNRLSEGIFSDCYNLGKPYVITNAIYNDDDTVTYEEEFKDNIIYITATTIPTKAFDLCSSLTKIELSSKCTNIETEAFIGAELIYVRFNSEVTVNRSSFYTDDEIVNTIIVECPKYCEDTYVDFAKEVKTFNPYITDNDNGKLYINYYTQNLDGNYDFSYLRDIANIKEIIIKCDLIPTGAFTPESMSLNSIEKVIIGRNVIKIDEYAFTAQESLINDKSKFNLSIENLYIEDIYNWFLIDFYDNPMKCTNNVFINDLSISHNLIIPKYITTLKANSIFNSANSDLFRYIFIPECVTEIEDRAIACAKSTVVLLGNVWNKNIHNITYYHDITTSEGTELPDNYVKLPEHYIKYNINYDSGYLFIEGEDNYTLDSFSNSISLVNHHIEYGKIINKAFLSTKEIPNYCFLNYTALKLIELKHNLLLKIGNNAFQKCNNLSQLYLYVDNVSSLEIGNELLKDCDSGNIRLFYAYERALDNLKDLYELYFKKYDIILHFTFSIRLRALPNRFNSTIYKFLWEKPLSYIELYNVLKEFKIKYRWLYTIPVFNDLYLTYSDFDDLNLMLDLKLEYTLKDKKLPNFDYIYNESDCEFLKIDDSRNFKWYISEDTLDRVLSLEIIDIKVNVGEEYKSSLFDYSNFTYSDDLNFIQNNKTLVNKQPKSDSITNNDVTDYESLLYDKKLQDLLDNIEISTKITKLNGNSVIEINYSKLLQHLVLIRQAEIESDVYTIKSVPKVTYQKYIGTLGTCRDIEGSGTGLEPLDMDFDCSKLNLLTDFIENRKVLHSGGESNESAWETHYFIGNGNSLHLNNTPLDKGKDNAETSNLARSNILKEAFSNLPSFGVFLYVPAIGDRKRWGKFVYLYDILAESNLPGVVSQRLDKRFTTNLPKNGDTLYSYLTYKYCNALLGDEKEERMYRKFTSTNPRAKKNPKVEYDEPYNLEILTSVYMKDEDGYIIPFNFFDYTQTGLKLIGDKDYKATHTLRGRKVDLNHPVYQAMNNFIKKLFYVTANRETIKRNEFGYGIFGDIHLNSLFKLNITIDSIKFNLEELVKGIDKYKINLKNVIPNYKKTVSNVFFIEKLYDTNVTANIENSFTNITESKIFKHGENIVLYTDTPYLAENDLFFKTEKGVFKAVKDIKADNQESPKEFLLDDNTDVSRLAYYTKLKKNNNNLEVVFNRNIHTYNNKKMNRRLLTIKWTLYGLLDDWNVKEDYLETLKVHEVHFYSFPWLKLSDTHAIVK